ncbi:MAG TPA: DUF1489 domain-containing protein [Brevundimonas sp.]
MPLHMIKLCVGVAEVETLEQRSLKNGGVVVQTKMTPKRADEMEDGGSLYWVMKGSVVGRQTILDIKTLGEGPAKHCLIQLAPEVIRTAPQARRPFQGWRYLEAKDAPPDLTVMEAGDLPDDLAQQLREMGAW